MLAVVLLIHSPAMAKNPEIGKLAPDFTLRLVNGEVVKLSQLRGQVVVLNFWATWCIPCRTELPTLDAYYRVQKRHGLRVFAVTTEDSVPEYLMKALFSKLTVEPVHKIIGPYHYLEGVPTNFVIDRSGIIRYARADAFNLASLNQILVPLLREPPPADIPASTQ